MNLENIGKDCPCYEFDCSDIMFDIGEFCGLPPNNGKLTIQVNGETVGDFSANQQEDETINIITPTSQDIADAVAGEALLREQADTTLQGNIDAEELARQRADRDIQAVLDGESLARVNADRDLQSQIDAIASKSDVVDVVGTYAELQAYDTSKLNDNDVVKVLDDSTHNDTMTYYRWNKTTQTWSYIGQESPYYSKSQMDTLLATKQNNLTAGNGIDITGDTISADTTVLATKSDLDSYAEKSNTYTKSEVDNLVEPKLSVEMAESLPAVGEESKLYLTPKAHTTQTATGNPISATITDGAGQIEDFQLDGDTYQQSYEGWNILDVDFENTTSAGVTKTLNADKTITLNGKINAGLNFTFGKNITFDTSSQYTLKVEVLRGSCTPYTNDGQPSHQWAVMVNMGLSSLGWQSYAIMCADDVTTVTFTPAQATGTPRFWFGYNASTADETTGIFNDYTLRISVKKGTTISGYEPYIGGIASPNPDYPQPIQVVTGEQTVSINGTDYPISLGSIELCKLGTYQDYIYKDGDDWKVHKEIAKSSLSTDTTWSTTSFTAQKRIYAYSTNVFGVRVQWPANNNTAGLLLISHFTNIALQTLLDGSDGAGLSSSGYLSLRVNSANTAQDILDIIDNNNVVVYGKMTATDTVITDSALIAQLEAIRAASLENGSNTLTNSATGSNLAGDMEVDYFGYDPTNRYDKWLWLDINNAYEKLGS